MTNRLDCPNCNDGNLWVDSHQLYSYPLFTDEKGKPYTLSDAEEYHGALKEFLTCSNQCGFEMDQAGNTKLPDVDPYYVEHLSDYLEDLKKILDDYETL